MDGPDLGLHNSNMARTNTRTPAAPQLPTYGLYGESTPPQSVDALHCETIADRSRLHDWEIRPHRHSALLQILHMVSGQVHAQLESATLVLQGPAWVVVPPRAVHGFRFSTDVQGTVVTVAEAHARRLLDGKPGLAEASLAPRAAELPPAVAVEAQQATTALHLEFSALQPWRSLALDTALTRLLLILARTPGGARQPLSTGYSRAEHHAQAFRSLIELQFRDQPSMALMAAALAITPTQLNRVCQRVLGCNALAVLHARLLLEAQRELAFTGLSIKQIAAGLGFADAAYFTRFFERHAKATPSQWRARSMADSLR